MDHFDVTDTVGHIVNKSGTKLFNYLLVLLSEYEITPEQWGLLNLLWKKDGINQKELSELMFKDKTILTRMIGKLETKGMVIRQEHPEDRRAFLIFLTDKGRELKEILIPIVASAEEKYLQGLTPEEIMITKKVLKTISSNIDGQKRG
ncbi:MarR family transcriptional regulator [Jeotgalibacillus sp. ET6]|uniref:MarR family winged helix-turn-helix transcriptional regulator n=1 Tax=Jeotgalibacillus sp. ET6 TaxID=3037260 RepID=UPI00241831A1|nr:MarR family transcriptional regulator [Jeotgalibacillus sp. ET6]MDG5471298.1 MarR family transcriptional regulator [Jeotgalibacillus sp. ET6]